MKVLITIRLILRIIHRFNCSFDYMLLYVYTYYRCCIVTDLLHRGDLSSSMESLAYDSSVASPGSTTSHSQRTKRMRTSFKHHQLRSMKSYFAINQNPDAKDLKQLAQKTGLSKRVLQVRLHFELCIKSVKWSLRFTLLYLCFVKGLVSKRSC